MCKYSGSSTQPCQAGGNTPSVWDLAGSLPLVIKDGTTAYVYGPGGLPLQQINGSTTYWFHHDQIGSTRLITDSTGTAQATYTYDPYGGLASSTGSITNLFRYAGEYRDSESNFYYLRLRYFDAQAGQFLSRDPAISLTWTPYGYAGGNPLNTVDPSGAKELPCSLAPSACYRKANGGPTLEDIGNFYLGCSAVMDETEGVIPEYPFAQTVLNWGGCVVGGVGGVIGVDSGGKLHDKPQKPGSPTRSKNSLVYSSYSITSSLSIEDCSPPSQETSLGWPVPLH